MAFKIRNYLSVCLVSFIILVNCTPPQPNLLQETSINPEISYVGKSALDLFPIANDMASEIIPNPLLLAIHISLPTDITQQTSLKTVFHFESTDAETSSVEVSCENNKCNSKEFSPGFTLLGSGSKPIDVNDILIDSTDVFQIALKYLGTELNQFDNNQFLLRVEEQEGPIWKAFFRNSQGGAILLRISPQSGDIIEVLE